jgi:phosphohistidine phosphatase
VNLFIVRHGYAVDEGPGLGDADRFLSLRGRQGVAAVGAKLHAEGVSLDALFTSPLVRAVQTAELLAHALGFAGAVTTLPSLAPGSSLSALASALEEHGASVACVGHEPMMTALGAMLSGHPAFPSFRPGQVALIANRRLVWTLQPETLEVIRR